MPDIVKNISINNSSGVPVVTPVGAEPENISIYRDSSGTIIEDSSSASIDPTKTKTLAETLKTEEANKASASNLGQVKVGSGISVDANGTISASLNGLPDTNFSNLADGQVIKYDSVSEQWINSASSGSGHSIKGQDGITRTQRDSLQFKDSSVVDDSVNGRTTIEVIKRMTKQQIDNLGSNTDGFYESTDESDTPITAEDLEFDNTNTNLVSDNVQDAIVEVNSNLTNDISTVEPGNKAAYPHAENETFIWKSRFVKATSAIAVDDDIILAPNTDYNVTETNIAAVLNELNSNLSRIATAVPNMSNLSDIKSSITSSSGYTALDDGFIVFQIVGAHNSSINFDLRYDSQRIFAYQSGVSSTTGLDRTIFYDFKPINKGQVAEMRQQVFELSNSNIYFAPIKA